MAGLEAVTADLAPCHSAATHRTFVSSAAHHGGRFGSSLAEKQGTNRKELSASVQLGFFPEHCSLAVSKKVPTPLDGRLCGSSSKVQERGT